MADAVGVSNNPDKDVDTGTEEQYPILETLRLCFLRLVLASSILMMAFVFYGAVWTEKMRPQLFKWTVPAIVMTVITPIHHLATAFADPKRMRKSQRLGVKIAAWGDIALTVLEAIFYIAAVVMLLLVSTSDKGKLRERWFPQFALLAEVGIWMLALSILLLLPLKIICFTNPGWAQKGEPKDLPAHEKKTQPDWLVRLKYPTSVLFGRKMWRTNVPGEAAALSYLRGSLAFVSVCSIVAYGIYQAIILPISEMGMVPLRVYRAPGLDWTHTKDIARSGVEFKVLLLWLPHPNATTNFTDAVTATGQFRQRDGIRTGRVACSIQRAAVGGMTAGIVSCPPNPSQQDPNYADPWWDFPNFDIRVNYTGLLGPGGPMVDRVSDSVRAYLGMTKDINRVYLGTEPVSLFPGTDILSVANLVLRQRLKPASLGTLGFESQESYLVASIAQTITNPYVSTESDPNIGTLGFTIQNVINEWTIVQDYRSKSVLSGLSALGGLGSLISTLLVLVLGTTLVQAVIRSRTTSPFGFLHNLTSDNIRAECKRDYPKLKSDIEEFKEHGGLLKYLLDTLIDVEPLGYGNMQAKSATAPPNGTGSHRGSGSDFEKGGD